MSIVSPLEKPIDLILRQISGVQRRSQVPKLIASLSPGDHLNLDMNKATLRTAQVRWRNNANVT